MDIGVLGSGDIGGTIGRKWAEAGHTVHFGVRNHQEKAAVADEDLKALGVEFKPVSEAIKAGQVILMAVPSSAVERIGQEHGHLLNGKIVIDATNDFSQADMSSLPTLREAAPEAKLFRAFNSLGWENFEDPEFGGTKADHFYCGPEAPSDLSVVEGLILDVGMRPIRVGDHEVSPVIDNLTRLWATLAMDQGRGRHLALKLLE